MEVSTLDMKSRKKLDMRSGDTVRVHQKVQEGDKTRLQQFEGLVLGRNHGTEPGATFTVRRVTGGFGVEKIFPLFSPIIEKIEIIKRSKTGRGKLYSIRRQALKQISKRMKMIFVDITTEETENKDAADDSKENTETVNTEAETTKTEPEKNPVTEEIKAPEGK